MSDVSIGQARRSQEVQNQRYQYEMNKTRNDHNVKFKKLAQSNDDTIKHLQEEYEAKVDTFKSELEQKLTKIRSSHKEVVRLENTRLANELKMLKKGHEDQFNEKKSGHEKQLAELTSSQQKQIDRARRQFIREQAKWQTS